MSCQANIHALALFNGTHRECKKNISVKEFHEDDMMSMTSLPSLKVWSTIVLMEEKSWSLRQNPLNSTGSADAGKVGRSRSI